MSFSDGPAYWTVLDHILERRWRKPALWAGAACLLGFALVAVFAVGREGNAVDRAMLEASPGTASWNFARLMFVGRQFGNIQLMGPLAVVLTGFAVWRPETRRPGILVSATFFTGVAVGTGLKYVFGQSGPPVEHGVATENATAFPSGHTMVATLFFGCLAAFAAVYVHKRWLPVLAAGWEIMALGVGTSQILLRTHWLSDVLAGWFFAMGWLCLSAVVVAAVVGWQEPEPHWFDPMETDMDETEPDHLADGSAYPVEGTHTPPEGPDQTVRRDV